MANIIDGLSVSKIIKDEIKKEIETLNVKPKLVVILVGEDKASQVYVASKEKSCAEVGIFSEAIRLDENTTEDELLGIIEKLNNDSSVTGILCQLPLPKHINEYNVLLKIDAKKDVDCFHPTNVGLLVAGSAYVEPCTPKGCIELLKRYNIEMAGKNAVVVGRSNIVGKPLAHLLLQNNATVTIAHSKTANLKEVCLNADIVCAAVGIAGFIKGDFVKTGAAVIDVGINRGDDGKLRGDVAFDECSHASYITPVPKGVGPMTIAMLMQNTLIMHKNNISNINK